ncbi:intraflagellar transport protein 52 homolog [Anoplophora glabripennis]|uniref:intraflagellar transport protein 52 homolog n=1 Tax=Anoplophora glabripennis TaxID=217634 RepID=UPI000873EA87|nr:intraflagellar transport protein 52 homolog [Anoplophora glabripennis]
MPPLEEIAAENKNTIIVNASKQEVFKLNENYKIFQRKLKLYSKVLINKEEITPQILQNCSLIVLPGSQMPFEENEINTLKNFINSGGRILIFLTEGNPSDTCNINILLEIFGIIPNIDSLIRTHYYKYFHPKECFIADSQINSSLNKEKINIQLVYPFGCTMSVNKPSVVAFTSGSASFPVDRPLGALYYDDKSNGRLAAIGSGYLFSDKYIDQENNDKLREMLMEFLISQERVHFAPSDHDDIDLIDHHIVPETAELAERPKLCLTDAISQTAFIDYTQLFDHKMYSMNTNYVPEALKLYDELGVKHQALKIITPKFEAPYPPLQPAVFPPSFRDLSPPALELFDLDDAFSSVFSNLAQFTNKYMMNGTSGEEKEDKDLEFYITECAKIVNIEVTNTKDILYEIGSAIAKFKSIDTIK